MCTEIATFDVDNATKNYKRIIDLGPYKGSGAGYHWGAEYSKQFQGGVLTKNFEY